jgi:hypothetical protein
MDYKTKYEQCSRQKKYAWAQLYNEMYDRFERSFNQVEKMEEIIKTEIPGHIKHMLKELIKDSKKDITCPICLDLINGKSDMSISNCGHFLCSECFEELKERNEIVKCPECRKKI